MRTKLTIDLQHFYRHLRSQKINYEVLKERGLNNSNIQIFEKPLRYKEIAAFINKEVLHTSI